MGNLISNPPDATPFMETARSFGNYDLQSALADLIDNSITAKCKTIEIECNWNGGDPIIKIKDCLLYTSPSPRDAHEFIMPSSV